MNRKNSINKIRNLLNNGQVSIGSWMQIPDTSVAEIMGNAGYDWVAIDLEHGSINIGQLPDLFRALESGNTLPLVRIAEGTLKDCKSALDSGAGGVIVPMIKNAEQLKNLISLCCWPPNGSRGVGYSRANLFGKFFNSYIEEAQSPLFIGMIETIEALENLEDILNVSGLDAILIGPYDLSASLGITGQFDNKKFIDTISRIIDLAKSFNIPCGIHVVDPSKEELLVRVQEGYQFIPFSIDAVFLNKSSEKPKI